MATSSAPAKSAAKKPVPAKKAPGRASAKKSAAPAKTTPVKTTPVKTAPTKIASPQTVKLNKTPVPKADKKVKAEKVKLVRDSFTIPKTEYGQIADMKKRAISLGMEIKKSELIRAGLSLLAGASDAAFKSALVQIPTLKTGRPGKN